MQELSFPSDTEALDYYRSLAKSLQSDLDDTKLALDEFQASSKELETELERELQATEKQLKELRGKEESLLHEIDQWKVNQISVSQLTPHLLEVMLAHHPIVLNA